MVPQDVAAQAFPAWHSAGFATNEQALHKMLSKPQEAKACFSALLSISEAAAAE